MTKTIEIESKRPNSGPLVEELFVQYSKMREYAAELENKLEQKDGQFQKLLEQNVNWSQECNNINQINAQLTEESEKLKVHCKNLEEENSFFRDKHTTFDSNGNSVEPIIPKQPLPVVSEDVAKIIKKYNVYDLINSNLEDDECEILDEFVYKHIKTEYEKYEYIAQLVAVGYIVEKTQLFYLKHIDMSKADKKCDYFAQIRNDRFEHESVQNNTLPGVEVVGVRFTQAEIDSMQTGSYEQIEVAE